MSDFIASFASPAATAAAPAPAHAPAPGIPHAVPSSPAPSGRRWVVGVVLLLAAATGVAVWAWRARRTGSAASTTIRTSVASRRDLVRSVRLNGTVEATDSYVVAAPSMTGGGFSTLIITKLVKAGTHVKPGDVIVEFDPQSQLQNALDRRTDFQDLEEQIRHKKADHLAQQAKDQADLKKADDALKAAELEIQRNEVLSKIDAEKNQENLEQAKASLTELRNTFDLKRKARVSELRILEIQRDRARNAMTHAQNNAKKSTIISPTQGVAVLNTIWKGSSMGEVQEGDEVRTGIPFMQVMNPSSMRVRARVNQTDVANLKPGTPVTVHLDAYPDIALPGEIQRVAAIGSTSGFSTRVRTFTAVITINGTVPQLMPDLSAAVDVQLNRISGALLVPRDAVVTEQDKSYVFVRNGQNFNKQPVHVAAMNDIDAALDSGLHDGDVVLRSPDPKKGAAQ